MAIQLDNCMDKVYDVILVWLNNHTRRVANSFFGLLSIFVLLSCSHGKYDFDFKLLLSAKTSSLSYAYMHGHVSFEK